MKYSYRYQKSHIDVWKFKQQQYLKTIGATHEGKVQYHSMIMIINEIYENDLIFLLESSQNDTCGKNKKN